MVSIPANIDFTSTSLQNTGAEDEAILSSQDDGAFFNVIDALTISTESDLNVNSIESDVNSIELEEVEAAPLVSSNVAEAVEDSNGALTEAVSDHEGALSSFETLHRNKEYNVVKQKTKEKRDVTQGLIPMASMSVQEIEMKPATVNVNELQEDPEIKNPLENMNANHADLLKRSVYDEKDAHQPLQMASQQNLSMTPMQIATSARASAQTSISENLQADVADLNSKNLNLDAFTPVLNMLPLANEVMHLSADTPIAKQLTIDTPVESPSFNQAFTESLVWIAKEEFTEAELSINPPELGPVKVSLQMEDDKIHMLIAAESSQMIEKAQESIDTLKSMLEQEGFTEVNIELQQQTNPEQRRSFSGREENNADGGVNISGATQNDTATAELSAIQKYRIDFYA